MYRLAVVNSHPIQYFAPLYRRLAKEKGIDLTVYYCSHQGSEPHFDPGFGEQVSWDISLLEGYRHIFLPNLWRSEEVRGFLSLVNPAIVKELRKKRYDALLVHGQQFVSYLLAIASAKSIGTPVLIRGESNMRRKHSTVIKPLLRKPLMTLFYRICDACLTIGTLNENFYAIHGVNKNKMFLTPYSVDNEYFIKKVEQFSMDPNSIKAEKGLPIDKPLILFVSKMKKRKRPFDLLLAYHEIQKKGIDAALIFVGSGEEEQSLKEYVKKNNMSNVYFFGFVNQSELPKFYALSDIFVLPSENEPWGLIINEIMCAGLPIIASEEIGAVPDLVRHDYNGYIYKAGDVSSLTYYLSRLLNNENLRNKMGVNSKQIIENWDYERCVDGILSALEYVRK